MNYITYEIGTKNAFFIKPYNFNKNTISEEEFNTNIKKVKNELNIDNLALVTQRHTADVKKVTFENINEETVADAMVTDIPNIGLGVKVADCQAIFLYDPIKRVIGCVHSGWRGTVKKIVKNALDIMVNDYGSVISDIKVVICPSILQDHFEVDYDVYLEFKNSFNDIDKYTIYKEDLNKYYIDQETLNKDYLMSLGIKYIKVANTCTVCNGNKIHSYRYEKENSGRHLAVISL